MTLPKLALIPSGYKGGINPTVYSILPNNGDGDFTFSRSGTATRVNENGLIETVDSNVPRLDYSDSNCPSLLLEPQRTNLILFSDAFTGTNWFSTNTTSTPNNIISPSGELNGNKLQRTSTSASYRTHTIGKAASAITYTTSAFIKKGSDNYFAMRAQGSYPQRVDVRFRFDTEEIYYINAVSPFVVLDYGVEKHSNGWYRIHFTYTTDTHTSLSNAFSPRATDGNIDGSDTSNSSYAYVWGAQIEQGSYPTSYIPTTGSAVTRLKDECINGGNSSIFSNTTGTVFVDFEAFTPINNFGRLLSLSDQTSNNTLILIPFITNQFRFSIRTNDGSIDVDTYQSVLYNTRQKIAISYELNSVKIYINGTLVFTDTSVGTFSNLTKISFADVDNNPTATAKIYELIYFDSVISQTEAETLTTL